MKFIGITGGVGAGKSEILSYLAQKDGVRVMLADDIAHDLMQPGTQCHDRIRETFPEADIFLPDESIDRKKMAAVIFSNAEKRERMNAVVHPAVKAYVLDQAEKERRRGGLKILFLEAALLIEEHYDEICDELWYIYTREEIREQRLMESRGYPAEKIRAIFESQLKEEEYIRHCSTVIDNNGPVREAFRQIDELWKNI